MAQSSSKHIVSLSYIALASRDVERTSAFLASDLGLAQFEVEAPGGNRLSAFRVGTTALVVAPEDHTFLTEQRVGVDHIAIAAKDVHAMISATSLTESPVDAVGLNGQVQRALSPETTCGVNVRFTPSLAMPAATPAIVSRIDHVGIASINNEAAESVFCERIGAQYESRQTDMEITTALESFTSDKYGAVYHTRQPRPIGGLRVSFLTIGDLELEFLSDFDPAQGHEVRDGESGTTKQDQSAIGRYITARGSGLHHIAFKVSDIDEILSKLAANGLRLIDHVGRPGSRRSRIGFVHPGSTGGVLFHFVERNEID